LGYFILNWRGLDAFMPDDEKCISFAVIILLTVFVISSSLPSPLNSASNIDYNGHLGGILGGIFLSVIVPQPLIYGTYEKNAKMTCTILYLLFISLCLIYFFFINSY
jgi:membrane associated rhomboid family serine protease